MADPEPTAPKSKVEPDAFSVEVGRWIAGAIEASGQPASAVSKAAGIAEPNLSVYRSGKKDPNTRTLVRISAATGYDLRPLMVKLTRIVLDEAVADSERTPNANA